MYACKKDQTSLPERLEAQGRSGATHADSITSTRDESVNASDGLSTAQGA